MFRSTSTVIYMLLLCLLFMSVHSASPPKHGKNRSSSLNRQKRTFGLGLFGSRDWSPFYQSWRMPTFTTMPSFVHLYDDEQLYGNIIKKISELEIGQKRIINYLQRLHDDKNANPCEARRTETVNPTPPNAPQLEVDAGLLYREPLTTTVTGASGSEEFATELPVAHETTETEHKTSLETSSEESRESAEADLPTTVPARDIGNEEFMHIRAGDFTERNDVL